MPSPRVASAGLPRAARVAGGAASVAGRGHATMRNARPAVDVGAQQIHQRGASPTDGRAGFDMMTRAAASRGRARAAFGSRVIPNLGAGRNDDIQRLATGARAALRASWRPTSPPLREPQRLAEWVPAQSAILCKPRSIRVANEHAYKRQAHPDKPAAAGEAWEETPSRQWTAGHYAARRMPTDLRSECADGPDHNPVGVRPFWRPRQRTPFQ